MSNDVIIVVPPVLTVVRPMIGPSILKAQLIKKNISTRVYYANIGYAKQIGLDSNEWFSSYANTNWLLSEWIFSRATFHQFHEKNGTSYIDEIIGDCSASFREEVDRASIAAVEFLELASKNILKQKPKIVGFSTSFEQTVSSVALSKIIKQQAPEVLICFGGSNCLGSMGQGLLEAFDSIDYVFNGEADNAFPEFCKSVLIDGQPPGERRVIKSASIVKMDDLPIPDYSDFFSEIGKEGLTGLIDVGLAIETSRGCWWGAKHHCTFCGLNPSGMKFRSKSSERALSEIKYLSETWNVKNFAATDNIMDFNHIKSVFKPLADEGAGFRFFYEIKSNLKDEQLEVLATAGVDTIQPGIESLSDHTLKLMKKGVSALQNIFLLKRCKELNIHPIWNILGGFPGETNQSYLETTKLIPKLIHLHPPRNIANLRLDRFSPNFENSEEMGFHSLQPLPSYKFVYPMSVQKIEKFAYFFEGTKEKYVPQKIVNELIACAMEWQRTHFKAQVKPVVCAGLHIAGLTLIKDTRPISKAEMRCLNQHETLVIQSFDIVRSVESELKRLSEATGISINQLTDTLSVLEKHSYIVRIKDAALSIVTFPSAKAVEEVEIRQFPGGDIKGAVGEAFASENSS